MIANKNFDIQSVRADFPILHQSLNGKPLVYFDNAATTQKPQVVLDTLSEYYQLMNANIHRGIHTLAERATAAYEETRDVVKSFINAKEREEIVFTRGTTEALNLIAQSAGKFYLRPGDEVLISTMEHHSNIVPWQMICDEIGAKLVVMPINEAGEIMLEEALALVNERTKILSVVYVSNALGTINPVKVLIDRVHAFNGIAVIDGAQAVSHLEVDVQALDADFLVFSGHKLYGPTGIGVLYGKRSILEAIPPYQGGGEMIKEVSFEKTTYNELPYKFEAGTPNIADTVALKSAIEYINQYGKSVLAAYEDALLSYATEKLTAEIEGFIPVGTAKNKVSVLSFRIEGVHHQDLGVILDNYGIAVRTGHHCTQPLMKRLGILGTARASFAFYNTKEEIDALSIGLQKALKMLR